MASTVDWQYMYDTRIEVIDPMTKRVPARHTFDRSVTSILPGPRAAFVMLNEAGEPEVRVLRLKLER